MATAYSSPEKVEFVNQLNQIKTRIETYFKLLVDCLKERENQLLSELEEISSSHKDAHQQSLSEIEIMLKQTQENIHSNFLKGTQFGIVKMLQQQKGEIESKLNSRNILFDFDDTLLDKIKRFGSINLTVDISQSTSLPIVDYADKVSPVVSVGGTGRNDAQFNLPWGLSVDYTTDNIYVVDQCNYRMQVFTREGKYLFKFGYKDGVGKMKLVPCVTISKRLVFVSENRPKGLLVYDLNGNFIKQVCKKGEHNKGLSEPFGIAIDDVTGDIYVCDSTDQCVKIFTKDFSYKSEFGRGIISLRDVKLTNNKIYLLSNKDPFLFIFNSDLIQVDRCISDSISKQLNTPNSFVIDGAGNFIFPSYNNNNILIFDKGGKLVHKITESICKPVGVTIDSQGRIVVVGHNNNLLIF